MITDLEPDVLECEVEWALESITTNKASGGDRIPVELFQILKDDAVKVLQESVELVCVKMFSFVHSHINTALDLTQNSIFQVSKNLQVETQGE